MKTFSQKNLARYVFVLSFTTSAPISYASLNQLITQISWIKLEPGNARVSQANAGQK